MTDWNKAGWLGSLRLRTAREVREHRRKNTTVRKTRRPLATRALNSALGQRGLPGLIAAYTIFTVMVIYTERELALEDFCFICIPSSNTHKELSLDSVNGLLLNTQIVMIGLLFPIAVGLVTVIAETRDAGADIDVQVYYSESLAYRVGASGIALALAIAIQLLWPFHATANIVSADSGAGFSKEALTIIHTIWLALNMTAMWHFLTTSLSFIGPTERARLRKRFAANVVIPQSLSEQIAKLL